MIKRIRGDIYTYRDTNIDVERKENSRVTIIELLYITSKERYYSTTR